MTEPETIQEDFKKDHTPAPIEQKDYSIYQNKDVYFVIIIPSEEKINFKNLNYETNNKIEPSIVFNKAKNKEDKTFILNEKFQIIKKEEEKKLKSQTSIIMKQKYQSYFGVFI